MMHPDDWFGYATQKAPTTNNRHKVTVKHLEGGCLLYRPLCWSQTKPRAFKGRTRTSRVGAPATNTSTNALDLEDHGGEPQASRTSCSPEVFVLREPDGSTSQQPR